MAASDDASARSVHREACRAGALAAELEVGVGLARSTASWSGVRTGEAGVVTSDGVAGSCDSVVGKSCEASAALVGLEDSVQVAGKAAGAGGSVAGLAAQVAALARSCGIHVVAWHADASAVDQLGVGLTGGTVVVTSAHAGGAGVVAELAVARTSHVVVEGSADAGAARGEQRVVLAADAAVVEGCGACGTREVADEGHARACCVEGEASCTLAGVVELERGAASAGGAAVHVRVDAVVALEVAALAAAESVHEVACRTNARLSSGQHGVRLAGQTLVGSGSRTGGAGVVAQRRSAVAARVSEVAEEALALAAHVSPGVVLAGVAGSVGRRHAGGAGVVAADAGLSGVSVVSWAALAVGVGAEEGVVEAGGALELGVAQAGLAG
jgi:hypothetical protein